MKNTLFSRVGQQDDDTQFRIEIHMDGLWSKTPEVRIRREFRNRPSRYGPSFPESTLDDLIAALQAAKDEIKVRLDKD